MNLLIIGGTAFFGPPIVRRAIEGGHRVLVYHRGSHEYDHGPDVPHLHGTTLEIGKHRDAIKEFAPDAVIDTTQFMAETTESVIDAISGVSDRYVVVSSGDVYRAYGVLHRTEPGPLQPMPVDETAELRTKQGFDNVATEFEDNLYTEQAALGRNPVAATILRAPATFGPGDPQGRISGPMKRLRESSGKLVLAEESANFGHTHGYIDNIADALLLCAFDRREGNFVYNAGFTTSSTALERYLLIADAKGWDGEITSSPDIKSEDTIDWRQELVMDTTRIREDLGYEEAIPVKEAMRRSVEWELPQS